MSKDKFIRDLTKLSDPKDAGLEPLEALDPDEIEDFDALLRAMSKTAFGGRAMGEALDVLETMVRDPKCHVVLTLSGAMTVAKMGKIICAMIDKGWVDTIISTGALMAHGFIESLGLQHYKYDRQRMDDVHLCKAGLNRVYDTLEPEWNFMQAEEVISAVLEEIKGERYLCSQSLCSAIGRHLSRNYSGKGILKSAYEREVAVYIPAFTDSELALDVATDLLTRFQSFGRAEDDPAKLPFQFNPFLDLFHYTRRMVQAERLGIFTIGGGVPRNWAQQLGPFVEIASQRLPELEWEAKRFQYGVRICPEPDHWGGLSGCSYEEGISWGKFVPPELGGRFAEVHADATIAWPILVKGLQSRLRKRGPEGQGS